MEKEKNYTRKEAMEPLKESYKRNAFIDHPSNTTKVFRLGNRTTESREVNRKSSCLKLLDPYLDEYQVVRIGGRSNHIDKKDSKVGLSRRSRSVGGVVTFSRSSRIVDMSCLIFRREITHRNEW